MLSVVFVVHVSSYAPQYKSDMRDVGGEMTPLLHQGDLVIVAQPEQTPLAWYYLPGRPAVRDHARARDGPELHELGRTRCKRLQRTQPAATLDPLVASLKPGQQLLFVRPLTEGAQNWKAPWTQLVRRRSAQWGQILQDDVNTGVLKQIAAAPHNYRGACCVADSAVLYEKVS